MTRFFPCSVSAVFSRFGIFCLAPALICGLSNRAAAQDPNHVLRHTDGNGALGSAVALQVVTDNTGGNVDGWSFGVCIDPTQLEVVSVVSGALVQSFNGGQGPFFSQIEILSDGWTAGLVVN